MIILGGGVAGLSAAHELMERGFKVAVYEKRQFPAAKRKLSGSRQRYRRTHGLAGRARLPLFPRYYRNLPDTMKRIPLRQKSAGVYDNLIQLPRLLLAPDGLWDGTDG